MAVGELAASFPVTRSAVSQHLRVLKDAGLVSSAALGTRRVYTVDPAGITALRDYLDRFWGVALQSFKSRVESNRGASNA